MVSVQEFINNLQHQRQDDIAARVPRTHIPDDELPPGGKQLLKSFMPFIDDLEGLTGMGRKELTLNLLKTGLKGGSIDSLLLGLAGKPAAADVKFVRRVKTLAVWVPVLIFLLGFSLISLVLYAKFVMSVMGV